MLRAAQNLRRFGPWLRSQKIALLFILTDERLRNAASIFLDLRMTRHITVAIASFSESEEPHVESVSVNTAETNLVGNVPFRLSVKLTKTSMGMPA